MNQKTAAQLGLASFFLVLIVSSAVVLYGAAKPSPSQAILVGDHVPAFTLPNSFGKLVSANDFSDGMLLLVYASPARLTASQQAEIRQIADAMRRTTYLEVIAVTDRMTTKTDPSQVLAGARELLVDENQDLRSLLGHHIDPMVCLLDRSQKLCFRTTIPDGPVDFSRTDEAVEAMRHSLKTYASAQDSFLR